MMWLGLQKFRSIWTSHQCRPMLSTVQRLCSSMNGHSRGQAKVSPTPAKCVSAASLTPSVSAHSAARYTTTMSVKHIKKCLAHNFWPQFKAQLLSEPFDVHVFTWIEQFQMSQKVVYVKHCYCYFDGLSQQLMRIWWNSILELTIKLSNLIAFDEICAFYGE